MTDQRDRTPREREERLRHRAHEIEDALARDRRETRPVDAAKRPGPVDQPLPNRNSRVVRPGD
jgi:hypothetical protein